MELIKSENITKTDSNFRVEYITQSDQLNYLSKIWYKQENLKFLLVIINLFSISSIGLISLIAFAKSTSLQADIIAWVSLFIVINNLLFLSKNYALFFLNRSVKIINFLKRIKSRFSKNEQALNQQFKKSLKKLENRQLYKLNNAFHCVFSQEKNNKVEVSIIEFSGPKYDLQAKFVESYQIDNKADGDEITDLTLYLNNKVEELNSKLISSATQEVIDDKSNENMLQLVKSLTN